MMHSNPLESRVPSVERALDLLEIVGHSSRGLTVRELSRKLQIPYSSAYYLVFTLAARGYLQRIPGSRQYSLGLRAFDFEPASVAELQLRSVSYPYIRALADQSGITAQTGVRIGHEGTLIARAIPPQVNPSEYWLGRHFELYCTAIGKTLIAWLSDGELDRLFAEYTFFRFTPKTISSLDSLRIHLADVRRTGFAVADEEQALGVRAIAAPVFNHVGNVIAAVSIGGMTPKPMGQVKRFADELVGIANQISRQVRAN